MIVTLDTMSDRQHRADVLLHPIRLRIVQALVGQPMTPLDVMRALGDVPQATLYRHINRLADAGLLQVVHERPMRGGVERTYAVVEQAAHLGADELAGATTEDHFRYFGTFVGTLLADFASYLEGGDVDLAADGVGYRQVPMWLTDEEVVQLSDELREVLRRGYANEPGPGRERRLLSTIIFPDRRRQTSR